MKIITNKSGCGFTMVLMMLSAGAVSGQQAGAPADPVAAVRAAAAAYMDHPASVGLSVGVFLEGKRFSAYFGEKHKGRRDLPDPGTIYSIGSITKTFTGTLLARAVLEKRISLADDIRKYLDGDYPNLEYKGHFITVAQLLNHRSGLPYLMPDDSVYRTNNNQQIALFLNRLYRHYTKADFFKELHQVKLDTLPGAKFRYSNTAAQLCGYILERIYGMSYDQLLKKDLTGMLGMPATRISLPAKERERMPAGYDEKGALMPDMPNQLEGAGALKSTVADMLRYIAWHLDERHKTARLSHEPTWRSGDYWSGLNWQAIESPDKKRLIWQSGDVAGFTSYCVLYPELHMGIVVLTNEEDHTAPGRIEKMINKLAASLKPGAPALP